jgi:hypothetical protein
MYPIVFLPQNPMAWNEFRVYEHVNNAFIHHDTPFNSKLEWRDFGESVATYSITLARRPKLYLSHSVAHACSSSSSSSSGPQSTLPYTH